MPYYDHVCEECGNEFEELILKDADEVPCPKCGSTKIQRKVGGSRVGFRLYGEGFHNRSHKDTGDWSD